jgi:murein DD-endopeptidase MepM/ murein hydrolase activator NlpD
MLLRCLLLLFMVWPSRVSDGVLAQPSAPCGVVDAIDFPIDGLVKGYDDFSLYRARFGGNHTGIDIGFDRWGDPVRAAARGRVTYSDTEGWDTEKGVVIVEHTFPDGSIAYSLYGHMEQTDTILFPTSGRCVERGDVLGVIGWPSRGRPHLHYEIRDFLPNDGGPGYVTGNPLAEGWFNPLDFTALWRARLTPAFLDYVTFDWVATVPPAALDSGHYVVASGNVIEAAVPPRQPLWRIETDGVVSGLAALPGGRIAARTRTGQVMVLQNGRYTALWMVRGPDVPFLLAEERLIFVTTDGGLAAYDTAGTLLWTLPPVGSERVTHLDGSGATVLYGVSTGAGVVLRQIDAETGAVSAEHAFETAPRIAAGAGGWLTLADTQLRWLGETTPLARVSPPPGRTAALTADSLGSSYVYLGDSDGTLLAFAPDGTLRWRAAYPFAANYQPPLLAVGGGCLLYTLDVDGMVNVFNAADGELVNQLQLYAGGSERTSPRARVLRADSADRLTVASGFLTMVTLDGLKLGGAAAESCRLG